MDKAVSRKNGTLTINEHKPNKTQIRREMRFMLEEMTELDEIIEKGKKAEETLKEYEEEFNKLCKLIMEEDAQC